MMAKIKYPPALGNLPCIHQGKTRDTFTGLLGNGPGLRLIVATCRLSTHNVVHLSEVSLKDQVLTAFTVYMMVEVLEKAGLKHHLVAYGRKIYDYLPGSEDDYPPDLHLRAIVVMDLEMIPYEFIFRSYLGGSLYSKFYSKGLPNPYGFDIPPGLPRMARFDKPIFTPTDKSENDDPVKSADIEARYRVPVMVARRAYMAIGEALSQHGIEQVDGKFELGLDHRGFVRIGDEAGTPDSSRFCRQGLIVPGQDPPWLDKQLARDEAERVWGGTSGPPVRFESQVIDALSNTYLEALALATNLELPDFQRQYLLN